MYFLNTYVVGRRLRTSLTHEKSSCLLQLSHATNIFSPSFVIELHDSFYNIIDILTAPSYPSYVGKAIMNMRISHVKNSEKFIRNLIESIRITRFFIIGILI